MTKIQIQLQWFEMKVADAQERIDQARVKIQRIAKDGTDHDMVSFLPAYTKELVDALQEISHYQDTVKLLTYLAKED